MLKIDNLSNEIDMTAVRGGSQGITEIAPPQLVSGGAGSLIIAIDVAPQLAIQNEIDVATNNLINTFGVQNNAIFTAKA